MSTRSQERNQPSQTFRSPAFRPVPPPGCVVDGRIRTGLPTGATERRKSGQTTACSCMTRLCLRLCNKADGTVSGSGSARPDPTPWAGAIWTAGRTESPCAPAPDTGRSAGFAPITKPDQHLWVQVQKFMLHGQNMADVRACAAARPADRPYPWARAMKTPDFRRSQGG